MEKMFLDLLESELLPAMGCTEPISIALASAKARDVLGAHPKRIELYASSDVIKNVKSVVVPNTNGLKGIEAAAILGVISGGCEANLEILSFVTMEEQNRLPELIKSGYCKTFHLPSKSSLHIIAKAFNDSGSSEVEIKDGHTNIVKIVKNGAIVFERDNKIDDTKAYSFTLEDIFKFINRVDLNKVKTLIYRQIEYNITICEEGLTNDYGKRIGKLLLKRFTNDVNTRARAYAAAGSEARMNGCPLPVIINSGSGNQGITVSIPIYIFAMKIKSTEDDLIKSILLSNLVSLYLKKGIGKLSAYCGVVSASCGAAAGLTYLKRGSFEQVTKAISNTAAGVSGIVCDGAKSSCAAKVAAGVDAAIIAHYMALEDTSFDGDGIIDWDIEKTVKNISRLSAEGMRETDEEIVKIILENN